jgi:hypothetical protein
MTAKLHPAVRDLVDQLADTDPAAASDAEAALGWMLGDDDLGSITQFGLQQFLWYELPFKWMVETAVQHEIALHLADFLDAVGFARYAAIARGEHTRQVIVAWDTDVSDGYRAFRDAMSASGVEPPDLPDLRWGVVMGRVEYDAFWSTAAALEIAAATGDMPTVGRRSAIAKGEVAHTHLTVARPELGGDTLLVAVHRERIAAWANLERGGARAQLIDPILNQLISPVPAGGPLAESLRPLRLLLDVVEDGEVELTTRDYLPRQLVIDLAAEFDWLLPGHERPRGEIDVPQVAALHELVTTRRLVRRKGRTLLLTKRGRDVMVSDETLATEVASSMLGEGFEAAATELFLASMLAELHRSARDRATEVAVALTEEGWSVRGEPTGSPVPLDIVERQFTRMWRDCVLFGWAARGRPDHADLTPEGRLAARVALRSVGSAPRTSN